MKITDEEKEMTAMHEAGHALAAVANKYENILHKVNHCASFSGFGSDFIFT